MTDAATGECGDAEAVGAVLRDARETIEDLATDDGDYHVACRRTGVRPEPVTEVRFDDRSDARRARDAAGRYRDALADLDPERPTYDLDVYDGTGPEVSLTRVRETTDERRENGLPASRQSVLLSGARADEWLRVENGPVVHVAGADDLLDDEIVSRQLAVKL